MVNGSVPSHLLCFSVKDRQFQSPLYYSSLLRTKQLPPLRKTDILKRKGVKTVQVTVNYDSYARWIEKWIYIFAPQTKNNWLSRWGRCLLLSLKKKINKSMKMPLDRKKKKICLWSRVGFLFSLNLFLLLLYKEADAYFTI